MRLRVLSVALLILVLAAVGGLVLVKRKQCQMAAEYVPGELPVLHTVPEFELKNSEGSPVTRESLLGKVWVADLIFTTCADTCPAMTRRMAAIHDDYRDRPGLNFVSVSVNPNYDRPNVLSDYAEYYNADVNRWHFLTGTLEAVTDMSMNGLMIGNKDNPVDHSTYFVLVDDACRVRGYYDGKDEDAVKKLRADVDRLLSGEGEG